MLRVQTPGTVQEETTSAICSSFLGFCTKVLYFQDFVQTARPLPGNLSQATWVTRSREDPSGVRPHSANPLQDCGFQCAGVEKG